MRFDLFTVLLLDMSGSILSSGSLPALQGAARTFVGKMTDQAVAIHIFDGRESLERLVDFTTDQRQLIAAIDGLSNYSVVDPSTNLNGAVLAGLDILNKRAALSSAGIKSGSLVLFTDGTDQAGRVRDRAAGSAAESTSHNVFTIGLGGEIDRDHLSTLGKDGAVFAESQSEVTDAFERIANEIDQRSKAFYGLGYCSPKRAGRHGLTLKVSEKMGQLSYDFDARNFGPGCDSSTLMNPCGARQCGTVAGFSCGVCSGATDRCNTTNGKCVDLCTSGVSQTGDRTGRRCGTFQGVECSCVSSNAKCHPRTDICYDACERLCSGSGNATTVDRSLTWSRADCGC